MSSSIHPYPNPNIFLTLLDKSKRAVVPSDPMDDPTVPTSPEPIEAELIPSGMSPFAASPDRHSRIPAIDTAISRQAARRFTTGKKINRKTNKCPVCKREGIEEIDQLFLWGVDAPTLAHKYDIPTKELNQHFWRHNYPERRFSHPAQLYRAFVHAMSFKDASPDAKLMVGLKALDRLVTLGGETPLRGTIDHNLTASSEQELRKLLGMPPPDEPEWTGETGVSRPPGLSNETQEDGVHAEETAQLEDEPVPGEHEETGVEASPHD